MWRQLKKLSRWEVVAWNLAALEANLCRGSTKHKIPKIQRKRPVQESVSKISCNFIRKETLAQVFSFKLWKIFKNSFWQSTGRWLLLLPETFLRSTKNLPQEFWLNSLKTAAKKFILVKFQSCISNWPL